MLNMISFKIYQLFMIAYIIFLFRYFLMRSNLILRLIITLRKASEISIATKFLREQINQLQKVNVNLCLRFSKFHFEWTMVSV